MCTSKLRPALAASCGLCLLCGLPLLGGTGCSDDGPAPATEVAVVVQRLDAETHVPFFAMGHSSTTLPFGGKGLVTPADGGVLRSASITFQDVAEGESYRLDYVGFHQLPTFPARPPAAGPWLCYYERATKIVRVVSGVRTTVSLEPDAVSNRCVFLAGDRYVVNPNYTADPYDARYGSVDRENVLTLFIHALTPVGTVTVKACDTVDPGCTAPFGVFAALPDGLYTPWPAHTGSGWARELTVTTDASGDALVYLVVKPGESPQLWEVEVQYAAGTTPSSEVFRVRLSNGNRIEVRAQ